MVASNHVKQLLEPIIKDAAARYSIDSKWIKAIIAQESAWNLCAVRYEPDYKYLYKPESFLKSGLITLPTETVTQKMSWGLGQIMGALARENGHLGFMGELLIPDVNVSHIAMRLAQLKKLSKEEEFVFAGYNGGPGAMRKLPSGLFPNQRYVTSVQLHMSKLI